MVSVNEIVQYFFNTQWRHKVDEFTNLWADPRLWYPCLSWLCHPGVYSNNFEDKFFGEWKDGKQIMPQVIRDEFVRESYKFSETYIANI